jgi:beta-lactamase regulating signal transducer with metallopeptidase domain/Leucine-rich repeat (LRR) protein
MDHATEQLLNLAWTQVWQLAALALAVALTVKFACRRRPHLAYLLWMLVIIKALTPPVWSSPSGLFSWALAQSSPARIEMAARPLDVAPLADSPAAEVAPVTTSGESPTVAIAMVPPNDTSRLSIGSVMLALWALGSGLLLITTLVKWVRMLGVLRKTREAVDPPVLAQFKALARRLGLRPAVRLVVTSSPLGPAAYGWWPGTVLVPGSLVRSKTAEQLLPILAHELVHLRRWDTLAGTVQLATQLVWWFHPAVWWANRQARIERERACDEEVVAELNCPAADYARTLVEILEWRHRLGPALAWPGMRAWDVTSQRLEYVLDPTHAFHRRAPAWCWMVLVASAVVALPGAGLQLAAAPQTETAGKPVDGSPVITGSVVLGSSAQASDTAEKEPEFTPEQREIVAELDKLGLSVSWDTFKQPPTLRGGFTRKFQPTDTPLPLEKLANLKALDIGPVRDEEELGAQLRAVKNLRAETRLLVIAKPEQSRALTLLREIPQLEHLWLPESLPALAEAGSPTGRTLRLSELKNLRSLMVLGVTDLSVTELAPLTKLEELYLEANVTDAGLDSLKELTGLRKWSLMRYSRTKGEKLDLSCLDGMHDLRDFQVTCPLSDAAMERIGKNTQLVLLALDAGGLTDTGFKHLAGLERLRSLSFYSMVGPTQVGPEGLAALGALKDLRKIDIFMGLPENKPPLVTDDVLESWRGLMNLRMVGLVDCRLSDRGMQVIRGWTQLRKLGLSGDLQVSDDGFQGLSVQMRELRLQVPNLTNRGLSNFSPLVNLEALTLDEARHIDVEALPALKPLKNLQSFALSRASLQGPGCAVLAELPKLETLSLAYCTLDNETLRALGSIKTLRKLNLMATSVTDDSLHLLSDLATLRELNLSRTEVSDRGLEQLTEFKQLDHLRIESARTTADGRSKLQKAIPGVHVDVNGTWTYLTRAKEEDLDD